MSYDPLQYLDEVRRWVVKIVGDEELRKYYRFRCSRFYGGSAVADSVGCLLKCGFCWSWRANLNYKSYGRFYSSKEVAQKLVSMAKSHNYPILRISGGEPTISPNHLLKVLAHIKEYIEKSTIRGITFVLETNGIVLGLNRDFVEELVPYRDFIFVRVSIKGCTPEEFSMLTQAPRDYFEYQIRALKNLLDYEIPTRAAVMVSFSNSNTLNSLIERLYSIDATLAKDVELEYVILYPHVVELLRRRGLKPRIAYDPKTWSVVSYDL